MKKFFFLLSICIVGFAHVSAQSGKMAELYWEFKEETGFLTISGEGDMPGYIYSHSYPWEKYQSSIKNVILEEGVGTVGISSFQNCSNLLSIVIPKSVKSVGNSAFSNCKNLTSIILNGSTPPILGSNVFYGIDKSKCTLHLPFSGDQNNYYSSNKQWRDFGEYIFDVIGGSLSDDVDWQIDKGVLTITGTGEMPDYNYSNSHWRDYQDLFTRVEIGNNITSIGESAFYKCENIISVEFPINLTRIGSNAFYGCKNLSSLVIPPGVTDIEEYTFYDCSSLNSITIPNSVNTIGKSAFYNCTNLMDLNLSNSLVKIGTNVFENTPWYKNQPDGPIYFGDILYENKGGLRSITHIDVKEGTRVINAGAFYYNRYLVSVNIPESVTEIGEEAFNGCTGLTSITVPNTVQSIGRQVFDGCTALKSLSFPLDACNISYLGELFYLSRIGGSVSGYYQQASAGNLVSDMKYYYIPNSLEKVAITNGKSISSVLLENVRNLQELSLANTFTSIAAGFLNKTSVNSIELPLKAGGSNSFMNLFRQGTCTFMGGGTGPCTSVTKIHIIDDCYISSSYFKNQGRYTGGQNITEVICPYITGIGSNAFEGTSIKRIEIPASVMSIGSEVFKGCKELTHIEVDAGNTKYGSEDGILFNKEKTEIIDVPDGKRGNVELTNSLTRIKLSDFENCINISSLVIPASVASIDKNSFLDCVNLSSFKVDHNNLHYSSLDGVLFNKKLNQLIRCPHRKAGDYVIPGSVSVLESYSFKNCKSLTSVQIPESITIIPSEAFSGCTKVTSVNIPASTNRIETYAFADCSSILSLYIPKDVSVIEGTAFQGCKPTEVISPKLILNVLTSSLEKLAIIGEQCTEIPSKTFNSCVNLKELNLPLSINKLGAECFSNLISLTTLSIPFVGLSATATGEDGLLGTLFGTTANNNMKAVTQYYAENKSKTYYLPVNLERFTIGNESTTLSYGALSGCDMITVLDIASSVNNLGRQALDGCSALTDIYSRWAYPPTTYDNTFTGVNKFACTLHVPAGSKQFYEKADGWKEFFTIQEEAPLQIIALPIPLDGGEIDGPKEYNHGEEATLTALNNMGYDFRGWMQNETIISTDREYKFTVTDNQTLYAIFTPKENADENISIQASARSAVISWTAVIDAETYSLVVYSDVNRTQEVARFELDVNGNIMRSTFRDLTCTLDDLQSEKTYYYTLIAYDNKEYMLTHSNGDFSTNGSVGFDSPDQLSFIRIFPNPVTDVLQIAGIEKEVSVTISDIFGKNITSHRINPDEVISVRHLPAGIYLVRIDEKTIKIIKK